MRHIKTLLTGLVIALSLSAAAFATPIDFNLTSPDSRGGILNSTYAMQYNYEEDALGLAVTGWSYGIKTNPQTCRRYRNNRCTAWNQATTSVNEAIEQDYVGKWDGLGVERAETPNHAVDNEGGDYDMHLLSFDELVALTTLDIGWFQGDTDISILAFNGANFDQSSLLGKTWQALLGTGWDLVGNYYNVDNGPNNGQVNQGGVTSQYWLVGSYNSNFGTTFSGPNIDKSRGSDYYKLKGVTVERPIPDDPPPVEVSEPNTLLLLTLGLLGLGGLRRRTT